MLSNRTALLVRCSVEEAAEIKEAAKRERRTLSAYILHTVLTRIAHRVELEEEWQKNVRVRVRKKGSAATLFGHSRSRVETNPKASGKKIPRLTAAFR